MHDDAHQPRPGGMVTDHKKKNNAVKTCVLQRYFFLHPHRTPKRQKNLPKRNIHANLVAEMEVANVLTKKINVQTVRILLRFGLHRGSHQTVRGVIIPPAEADYLATEIRHTPLSIKSNH